MAGENYRKDFERSAGLSSLLETEYGQLFKHITTVFALAFSTPFESILRYDFGERYYSWGSYISGVITMFVWSLIMGFLNMLLIGGFSAIVVSDDPTAPEGAVNAFLYALFKFLTFQNFSSADLFGGLFYTAWLAHVFFGLYHFYRMWYRSRTGQALHSFDPGKSRLRFLSRLIFRPINSVVSVAVKTLAITMPGHLRKDEDRLTPFFNQSDYFTKLYLEPFIVFFIGIGFVWYGWGLLGLYFLLGALGISHIARQQFLSVEAKILDLRDQFIDQTAMSDVDDFANNHAYQPGQETSQRTKNTAFQLAKMASRKPEIIDQVKEESPSLFEMMEGMDSNFQAMAQEPDQETIQNN